MSVYTTDYIGVIRTQFTELAGMPVQPAGADEDAFEGEVIINEALAEGLRDLDGFSHIYLIYHLHKVTETKMIVIPFMDTVERGIFATRSPSRPSRLGMSIVRLLEVNGNCLKIRGADMLDGTPLIDIKPYIQAFDCPDNPSCGWMSGSREDVRNKRSDDRFV